MLLIRTLIGLNVAVFLLWLAAGDDVSQPLFRFMAGHFVVSREHLEIGHYWTLLTSEFSQREVWHLAFNMIVLYSFGPVLHARWGTRTFLLFYLTAATAASLAHVAVGWLFGRDAFALGASGAMSALIAAFSVFHPRHKILLFGVVPLPAYAAMLLFVGLDVWGLVAQSTGGGLPIGHGAHLGGAAFGLAFAWLKRSPEQWVLSQAEILALIEKARAGGWEALTPTEHRQLEALLTKKPGPADAARPGS